MERNYTNTKFLLDTSIILYGKNINLKTFLNRMHPFVNLDGYLLIEQLIS